MEPIIVAVIAAISGILSGLVSGLIVTLVKPRGENWLDIQRGRRERRVEDLVRLHDLLSQTEGKYGHPEMRSMAAAIGDTELIAEVGRIIVADTVERRKDAVGDAMNRVGELRHDL